MIFNLKLLSVVLAIATSVTGGAIPGLEARTTPTCGADNCFVNSLVPTKLLPKVELFCYLYLQQRPSTVTLTATAKRTTTGTATVTATATNTAGTVTNTVTSPGQCSTTTTITSFQTVVNYPARGSDPSVAQFEKRADILLASAPTEIVKGCKPSSLPAKISSACTCLLKKATPKTATVTATAFTTTIAATATRTNTATVTQTILQTVTSCTSTSTITEYNIPQFTCGIPNPTVAGTSGSIVCPSAASPTETNAFFRIEGGSEGNIFDGCMASGPRTITTPSGGTHLCDGTNNNANPSPGGTLTTQIDAAGQLEGFGYDGTYSSSFSDFFISRIDATEQTGTQFWGVLLDRVFTPRGGCQMQYTPAQEGLWAFDAFAPNRVFLKLDPQYQVVRSGEIAAVTLTVQATNPNSGNNSPQSGATIGSGTVSDANGKIQLDVPTEPGCYQYKAEASNAIRSNAFYLTVLPPAE